MERILPTGHFHKTKLAFVNVDNILGGCVALHLAETLEKECKDVELVCMGKKIDHLDRLKKMKNVKLVQINYEDEKNLCKAMDGISCAIIVPEWREDRAKHGKSLIRAMEKEKVRGVLMVSVEGSEAEGLRELNSFHEIERSVQNTHWDHCYIILRKSILDQCFLLWGPVVKDQGEFPITLQKDSQMAPLDVRDLMSSIETIMTNYCRRQQGSKGAEDTDATAPFGEMRNKIYTLTGPAKITTEGFVCELNEATGQNVQFKQVSCDELRRYLESLKNRGWPQEDEVDAELIDALRYEYAPNDATIRLLLDELELIKRDEASFVSGDLEKITGHKGKTPRDFFMKEKDAFKGSFRREI
ncbi:hypothetical protein BG006_006985 [Podila minutissima]|uniref:NAD(P)-binding domain-containing protein n=1 Tax=Podila minutissima TaxID=64525 RepID=A0A9P5SKD1_9FUNG|nr:hypothetical protein BG006_006985 [Podila minutissima]